MGVDSILFSASLAKYLAAFVDMEIERWRNFENKGNIFFLFGKVQENDISVLFYGNETKKRSQIEDSQDKDSFIFSYSPRRIKMKSSYF